MKKRFGVFCILLLLISHSVSVIPKTNDGNLFNSYWISDKILIVRCGDTYPDQITAVKTEKGIVIIDSGVSPTLTKKYREIIEEKYEQSDFRYLINTHHHFDHTNGNQVFEDAVIIAHENAVQPMMNHASNRNAFLKARRARVQRRDALRNTLPKESGLYKRLRDLVITSRAMCDDYASADGYRLTLPTLTLNESLTLHMGDLTLQIVYFGPGFHTDNDLLIYIPEEHVLFTGDVLRPAVSFSHFTSDSDFLPWIRAIEKLDIQPDGLKIVTNHNGVLSGHHLTKFLDSLKTMVVIKKNRINGVVQLRSMFTSMTFDQSMDRFNNEILKDKDDRYYLWEGDFSALIGDLLDEGKYEEAFEIASLCEEIFPKSTNIVYWKADVLMKKGDTPSAIRAFKKALEMDPVSSYAADMIYRLENNH